MKIQKPLNPENQLIFTMENPAVAKSTVPQPTLLSNAEYLVYGLINKTPIHRIRNMSSCHPQSD